MSERQPIRKGHFDPKPFTPIYEKDLCRCRYCKMNSVFGAAFDRSYRRHHHYMTAERAGARAMARRYPVKELRQYLLVRKALNYRPTFNLLLSAFTEVMGKRVPKL